MKAVIAIWLVAGVWVVAAPPPVEPVSIAPLRYYQDACARCHGDYGENYGPALGRHGNDARLGTDVERMAKGPGGRALEGIDLAAQVAFHRSLILREPYIVWTAHAGDELSGEVTEGAELSARQAGKPLKLVQEGTKWTLRATNPKGLILTAKLNKKSTALDLGSAAFTHQKPIPTKPR